MLEISGVTVAKDIKKSKIEASYRTKTGNIIVTYKDRP